ncbi:unnamed protein product [Nippostrongylus brasiliensis]|uniref:DRBM domain-containing protein n=1 Tax=Nippostrongylus brasiliensis TaxID=27835 RepID=A0A0N4Y908_NIPBR|nr:unnamed protein product [Nippostrongylus brasiliensis]
MATALKDLFTPIDELRVSEPSYFESVSVVPTNTPTTSNFNQKTPAMVLEEGSRRVYGTSPEYHLVSEHPNFGYSCRLLGITVEGYAKTKKAARHIAARAMLHEIIKKDRHVEFGIPGKTHEEARRAVDGLANGDGRIETSEEDPTCANQNENFSGKLQQLCQRKRFESPQYSFQEEGPPNDRTFTTICKVVGQEVKGVAKTKRASKNIASQKMLAILEKGIADMNEEPSFDRGVIVIDDDMDSTTESPQIVAPVVDDAVAKVAEILSDSKRFDSPTQDYRILENKCALGRTQCLLKITYGKPGEQQPRTPYVFPGSDTTVEGAKQQAARGALVFFSFS